MPEKKCPLCGGPSSGGLCADCARATDKIRDDAKKSGPKQPKGNGSGKKPNGGKKS